MLIQDKLASLGWKKFKDEFNHPLSECSYQTWIMDDNDCKLFSVNCTLYDFTQLKNAPPSLVSGLQPTFDAQFNLNDDAFFNVEYCGKDVDKALKFFSDIFHKMNCTRQED